MRNKTFPSLTIQLESGEAKTYVGRVAWALRKLIDAGASGCTPIDHPGPRWSHYVWVLRRDGIGVETITERHGGPFPGTHARYVLRSPISIIDRQAA